MFSVDGRLFRLDNEGWISGSGVWGMCMAAPNAAGVVGGVENVSVSGDSRSREELRAVVGIEGGVMKQAVIADVLFIELYPGFRYQRPA